MVDAVESQGALKLTQQWLTWAAGLGPATGTLVVGLVVGTANNLVNNLPLGLIAGATIQAAHVKGLIANAVLIGVDLGPNFYCNRLACDDPLATRAAQGFFPRRSRGEARCQLLEISKGGCSCHAGGAACGAGRGRLDAPAVTHRAIRARVRTTLSKSSPAGTQLRETGSHAHSKSAFQLSRYRVSSSYPNSGHGRV